MKNKFLILILSFLFIACAKVDGNEETLPEYGGPVFYQYGFSPSGRAMYTLLTFPLEGQVQFQRFYLDEMGPEVDHSTPGTFSIEKAWVRKSGTNWFLTFTDSDCFAEGHKETWTMRNDGRDWIRYTLPDAPTEDKIYRPIEMFDPKIAQYKIEGYVRSKRCDHKEFR